MSAETSFDLQTPTPDHQDIFIGDGEMAQLMRRHDWAATPLGPPAQWPNALKVAIRLLLTSRFEMWLGWGPDIAFFYNDAYRPTLGNKHPRSLAMPTRVLWAEIWNDVEGRLRTVYDEGKATWDRALMLLLHRNGFPEETYHTFSYSPLFGDSGKVEGVFCAVTEETQRVIAERRMGTLRELASALTVVEGRNNLWGAAQRTLSLNRHDLPFSLIYLFDDKDGGAKRVCATGIALDHPLAPATLAADGGPWSLRSIHVGDAHRIVDLKGQPALPVGAWSQPPSQALLVPLMGSRATRPLGALLVGLNPFRPLDADYQSFIQLLAGQLAASLSNALLNEEDKKRTDALADAVQMRQEAADVLRQANARLITEVRSRTAERDHLRDLFQQAPSFICVLQGPDHVFDLTNEAYQQLVGHRDLVGLPIRRALPELAGQGYFELLDEVFNSGKPFVGRNLEVQVQRSKGAPLELRYVSFVYQPILGRDGKVSGVFVDGYDVTQQKSSDDALKALNDTLEQRVAERTTEPADAVERLRLESTEREAAEAALRQAQKMESLGALTGGVAHDFNNLLQVINGNIQLLSRDVAGNARAEARVHNALSGVARGAKLASQLLAFGRRQPLEPKVVNIGRFIKSMDDMLRRALGEEVEVETVISGGLWNTLIDPGQIENALLNLAINARDAMDGHGKLTIEAGNAMLDDAYVAVHEDLAAGQYVMVAVTDTGSGMAPEVLERVFEPFFSTKPEGKGTGLGLSMVYGFVKQSGGHIKIYSEPEEGTTVRLYLPRVFDEEDRLTDPASVPVRGGSETVLVVEDDEDVRETAAAVLQDLGYLVLKAKEAMSALSIIESGIPVDVLFTDVVMPGPLRSPELARKARERIPGIAVLFTSGYTQNAIVHGGRLDPGVDLLSKPYTREALARKIRHVLANQAQLAALAEKRAQSTRQDVAPPVLAKAERAVTVLLVEDDELIRWGTAELLTECGHTVLQARDAVAAMKLLAEQAVDVMLTDINLPGANGVELARQALQRWPMLGVVFATGDPAAIDQNVLRDAVVLTKPYQLDDLIEALARAAMARPG
jgi:signal transduction histidine kinase/DNA-binding response OmpR family regulator